MSYTQEFNEKNKRNIPCINAEAKKYILAYLDAWIDELGQYAFSYRKGIVRAIRSKIESIPTN